MERRSSKTGGQYKGELAYRDAQAQVSRMPSAGPASDILTRASQFLEENDLHTKITIDSMFNREIEGEEFIPQKALRDIWENRLQDFLGIILGRRPQDQDLAHIRDNLLKILSILVAIEWREWHKFHNIFLAPIQDPSARRLDKNIPFSRTDLEDNSFLGRRMGAKFWKEQSAFVPIVIEEGLDKEHSAKKRLPFVQSAREKLGTGSYGSVTKEVIAPHQFMWKDSKNLNDNSKPVARKRFTAYGDFKKETRNLLNLNSCISKHDHIVGYIAIIVIGDEASPKDLNILLPLASMNLQQFLYNDNSVAPSFKIADLLQEASNVADAIKWLHEGLRISDREMVCCHMDLKLDNILVYNDTSRPVGKWKISDFGISTIKGKERGVKRPVRKPNSETLNVPGMAETVSSPAESLSRLTKTARIPADRPPAIYQAPEVFRGNIIGRSSDIWSFGCILFQILARGVGPGVVKLKELDRLRCLEEDKFTEHVTDYFFRERETVCYLNPHVEAWLKESLTDRSYSDHEIVKACKRLILDILKINPADRLKARQVNDRLYNIWRDPLSDSMSVHSGSPISRSMSTAEPLPAISFSSFPGTLNPQDDPLGSSSLPPTTSNQQFETFQPMPVRSVTPPPDSYDPRQSHFIGGSHSFAPPTANTSHGTPDLQAQPWHKPSHGSTLGPAPNTRTEQSSQPVIYPSYAGSIQPQTPNGPNVRPTTLQHPPSNISMNQNQTNRSSASGSSHRSQSQASSAASRVFTEPVPYDSKPFSIIKKVLQAFVSPTNTNLAFMTENTIFIRTAYTPYSYLTIKTGTIQWECGSMAGDFLTAVGKEKTSKQRTFRVYQVSTNGLLQQPKLLRVVDPPSYYTQLAVSQHGRLIFQDSNCAWLYGYCNDTEKKQLKLTTQETSQLQSETLEMICFSNDGLWTFAVTPFPGNLHRIRVWCVSDITTSTYYDFQHERRECTDPIKSIIPFPKSPYCIVWAEHGKLYILSGKGTQATRQPFPVENLQALVVTPDEKAVIFITGSIKFGKRRSQISFSRLQRDNGNFSFSKQIPGEFLEQPLNNPSKCALAVHGTDTSEDIVTVLIAYCDGKYESKQVSFRCSG